MFYLILFLLVLVADQYTKLAITQDFFLGQSVPVLKGIFNLTYVQNTGGAFGIMRLFIVISIVVILFIIYFLIKEEKKDIYVQIIFSLVLGGAISNLIDRLRLGFVVDFIDFQVWPVFNIADAAITVGMVLLLIRILFNKEPKKEII